MPDTEGPCLELHLPSGWGESDLRDLLAPVRGVRIQMMGDGLAEIGFSTEDSVRATALLMQLNKGTLPIKHETTSDQLGSNINCVPSVATTLLAAHRHTWRTIEAIHQSLIDLSKSGPIHKADSLLLKLQLASAAREISNKQQSISDLQTRVDQAGVDLAKARHPISTDIHKQLQDATLLVQSTQKQLQEARDKQQTAEKYRMDSTKKEHVANTALAEERQARESEKANLETEIQRLVATQHMTFRTHTLSLSEMSSRSQIEEEQIKLHEIILDEIQRVSSDRVEKLRVSTQQIILKLTQKTALKEADHRTLLQQLQSQQSDNDAKVEKIRSEAAQSLDSLKDRVTEDLEERFKLEQYQQKTEFDKVCESNEELQEQLNAKSTELAAVLSQCDESDSRLQSIIEEKDVQIESYKVDISNLTNSLEHSQPAVPEKEPILQQHRSTSPIPQVEEEKPAEIRTELATNSTQTDLEGNEINKLQSEVKRLIDELTTKTAEASMWQQEAQLRSKTANDTATLECEIERLIEKESTNKKLIVKLRSETEQHSITIGSLETTVHSKTVLTRELEGQLQDLTSKLTDASTDSEALVSSNKEISSLKSEILELSIACEDLEGIIMKKNDSISEIEETLHRTEADLNQSNGEYLNFKNKYDKSVEEANSSRTQLHAAAEGLRTAVAAHAAEGEQLRENMHLHEVDNQKLRSDLIRCENQILELETKLKDFTSITSQRDTQISELQSVLRATTDAQKCLQTDLTDAQAALTEAKESIQKVNTTRREEITEATSTQKQLTTERVSLEQEIQQLHERHRVTVEEMTTSVEKTTDFEHQLRAAEERAAEVEQKLAEEKQSNSSMSNNLITLRQQLGQLEDQNSVLREELKILSTAAQTPRKENCHQCEIYQSARQLQTEVMNGLQTDLTDATREVSSLQSRLVTLESDHSKVLLESTRIRVMLKETESHNIKLQQRPSDAEYQNIIERLESAEMQTPVIEKDLLHFKQQFEETSQQLSECQEENNRIQNQYNLLESNSRCEASQLSDELTTINSQLHRLLTASYTAECSDWDDPRSITLREDGTCDGGFWFIDPPPQGTTSVELRMVWSGQTEQLLYSDNGGITWAGSGIRLEVIGSVPAWIEALVYKKQLEHAETRATMAEWRVQSASPRREGSPTFQSPFSASVQRSVREVSISRPQSITSPISNRTKEEFNEKPVETVLPSPASFTTQVTPAAVPVASVISSTPDVIPPPSGDDEATTLEQSLSSAFPDVEPTLLSGVAHNIIEGIMTMDQARLMLADMASMDAFGGI